MKNVADRKLLFRKVFFRQHKNFRKRSSEHSLALAKVRKTLQDFLKQFEQREGLKIAAYNGLPSEVPLEGWLNELDIKFWTPEVQGKALIFKRDHEQALLQDMDLVFVPALLVCEQGNRLGRGGGFYDRELPLVSKKKRVFIGFDWQVRKKLPIETHDQKIQWIISESGIRQTNI